MSRSQSRVGWLLNADMFDAYRDDLVAAIRCQGHEAVLVSTPLPPYRWENTGRAYRKAFPQGACVVTHGDIELAMSVRRSGWWTPGVYAAIERFHCSTYYCHLGAHLLNRKYAMLPFGDLRRMKEFLFDALGADGRVFVRPDSPLKIFTGQTVAAADFEREIDYLGFAEFPPETMVVVSPPEAIEAEWRFVVVDRAVVGGSQYKRDGKNETRAQYDGAAQDLAEKIAGGEFQPDRVWVLDVCRTTGGDYRLLEIGAFSFANLYACDVNAVAAEVSRVALADWEKGRSNR